MAKEPSPKIIAAVGQSEGHATAIGMTSTHLHRIYALVGRIALSWNEVDLLWYLILTCLMKDTPREQIDAVFHIFQTGAAQRQLIMTIAGTLPEKDKLRKRLGQLYAKTCDAAGNRNAAVHAVIIIGPGPGRFLQGTEIRVTPGSHPTKKNKLAGKQLENELLGIATEIDQLIADLDGLRNELAPKLEIRADILEDMLRQGLQVPSWVVPMAPSGPQFEPER